MECSQLIDFCFKAGQLIVTACIGVATGLIAYQQFKLAKHKLKIELYDRRYRVFDAARNFLNEIMRDGECTSDNLVRYLIATSDAEFFCDAQTVRHLSHLKERSLDLRKKKFAYRDIPRGELRSSLCQAESEALSALEQELKKLRSHFIEHLNINTLD